LENIRLSYLRVDSLASPGIEASAGDFKDRGIPAKASTPISPKKLF